MVIFAINLWLIIYKYSIYFFFKNITREYSMTIKYKKGNFN
jgi:hypothetical protein